MFSTISIDTLLTSGIPEDLEILGFVNGYILTVNPFLAMGDNLRIRHKLYVLTGVATSANTGKILDVYPPLPQDSAQDNNPDYAKAMDNDGGFPYGAESRHPSDWNKWISGCHNSGQQSGLISPPLPSVYSSASCIIDLQGRVMTAGLIDGHFHVCSWPKKIPMKKEDGSGQYRKYGLWIDASDPRYYIGSDNETDPPAFALQKLVDEIQEWLNDADEEATEHLNNQDGLYIHGWQFSRISAGDTFVNNTESYSLNSFCYRNASVKALLVITSGQSCWYNAELLRAYNEQQDYFINYLSSDRVERRIRLERYPIQTDESPQDREISLVNVTVNVFINVDVPFLADVIVSAPGREICVPFVINKITFNDQDLPVCLFGQPLLQEVDRMVEMVSTNTPVYIEVAYRPILMTISTADWPDPGIPFTKAYGSWDPCKPHTTNWYSGAERGLIEYYYDPNGREWKPTGYAEHYVMRDMLASVFSQANVETSIQCRRALVDWAHRHGITATQDIMFYRRSEPAEFNAYERLSYQREDDDLSGRLNLRVGLYYYLENAEQIDDVMKLAHDKDAGASDVNRLRPPEGHPEYPGWVKWLGWKLQLDGATGAKSLFSNAPYPKEIAQDGQPTSYTFGLLTMTNWQEQRFSPQEMAALVALAETPAYQFLKMGVVEAPLLGGTGWLGVTINTDSILGIMQDLNLINSGTEKLPEKFVILSFRHRMPISEL